MTVGARFGKRKPPAMPVVFFYQRENRPFPKGNERFLELLPGFEPGTSSLPIGLLTRYNIISGILKSL
jgi:hypothetical protein